MRRKQRDQTIDEFSEKLGLKDLMTARGGDLNMSEMQRVALARVLVTKPELLLLDEPMSNLDASLRASLRGELKHIQKDLDQTVLYVTHDQVEAMSMSDQIAVMSMGDILQIASPNDIYYRPKNKFIAEFLGDPQINMLECVVVTTNSNVMVSTKTQKDIALPGASVPPGAYYLGVRAHHINAQHKPFSGSIETVVRLVENFGSEHILHVTYGADLVTVMVAPGFAREGDTVHVAFDLENILLIDRKTELVVQTTRQEEAA